MHSKIFTSSLALVLSLGLVQVGMSDSFAAPGGQPGKPTDKKIPAKIIEKYQAGTLKSRHWIDICTGNSACGDGSFSGGGFSTAEANEVVCSSALDEEQLRECLGQPPIKKKAVRVKRVKVELNSAQ